MEGLRGATVRRLRRADGPAGGKARATRDGLPGGSVSGMVPFGRPTNLCSPNRVRYKSRQRIGPGIAPRAMTTRTAGTSIGEGREASAWKGADGACR